VITKKNQKHIISGYRAESRKLGHRLAKQPKTPNASLVEGEDLDKAKAKAERKQAKQAEAKARLEEKLVKGKAAHATANARYAQTRAHGNMPNRHDEYHVPNHGILSSPLKQVEIRLNGNLTGVIYGKDVRTGAYNLGMYKDVKRLPYVRSNIISHQINLVLISLQSIILILARRL
jgi:hypothetical protein